MATPAPPRVALITGAARRLGAAIARTLHRAGYDIALHYRDSQAQARALLQAAGFAGVRLTSAFTDHPAKPDDALFCALAKRPKTRGR